MLNLGDVKDEEVFKSLFVKPWHPTLIAVYGWILELELQGPCITEGYRDPRHKNDLHGIDSTLRAIDLRSWRYKEPEVLERIINKVWLYDPERPEMKVAKLHDTGEGMHFHIQVHDRTVRRVK